MNIFRIRRRPRPLTIKRKGAPMHLSLDPAIMRAVNRAR
jgi:hypothetical protein